MRKRMKRLLGKTVVLSGVSRGIGRELAKVLVKDYGCKIIGLARSKKDMDSLKLELGDSLTSFIMDVSIKEEWERLRDFIIQNTLQIDLIINNAGMIHPFKRFNEIDDEEMEKVLKTNFYSVFYSSKVLFSLLLNSSMPGIVNICSASAYLTVAGQSIYSASKSATLSFTESLREELLGKVYVGIVMPGPVKTSLYRHDKKLIVKDEIIERIGLKSEKVAKKIAWKISCRKAHISIGMLAVLMRDFYRLMPSKSIYLTGQTFKHLPLNTFKDLYNKKKKTK